MATLISHSAEETLALGEQWGRAAQSGWIVGLSGELGAGKTQLVKGIARGLGLTCHVLSPTFALVHEYPGGRLPLAHLDLYRLDSPEQILGAGLHQYLWHPSGVTVVEWIERWPDWRKQMTEPGRGRARSVRLLSLGESERQIDYEDFGD